MNMNSTMQEVMRLMRAGDLRAATEAIQRRLQRRGDRPSSSPESRGGDDGAGIIEGDYRHVPDTSGPATVGSESNGSGPETVAPESAGLCDADPASDGDGEFRSHRFTCSAGSMDYKLFTPTGLSAARAPLIVMLHGCTQSPDDFARGTRMNTVARQHGYVVAYPAQAQSKNASKCWNWFRSHDQRRGQGEPGVIAELTRDIVKRYGLDDRRVYVAGLSAGGAMAAVLGGTYPDVYAAIGVHSGLPFGVAHDLPSAFAAMKQGGRESARARSPALTDPVPAIVFHGDRDTTVDARNGAAVIAQSTGMEACQRELRTTVERGAVPNGRKYTRTIFFDANGKVVAEQWVVHGAGHAWSGGNPSGSYTDPSGPDASGQIVRFFSALACGTVN